MKFFSLCDDDDDDDDVGVKWNFHAMGYDDE
jgi:hypothetical protein